MMVAARRALLSSDNSYSDSVISAPPCNLDSVFSKVSFLSPSRAVQITVYSFEFAKFYFHLTCTVLSLEFTVSPNFSDNYICDFVAVEGHQCFTNIFLFSA